MFAVDDFVLWFAWYFAEDLAMHPSTAKLMEKAGISFSGDPPPAVVEHPEATLDWLSDPDHPATPRVVVRTGGEPPSPRPPDLARINR